MISETLDYLRAMRNRRPGWRDHFERERDITSAWEAACLYQRTTDDLIEAIGSPDDAAVLVACLEDLRNARRQASTRATGLLERALAVGGQS